jgi:hypothetical protein
VDDEAGSLDDIATILNEPTPLRRELVLVYGRVVEDILQGSVDLLVRRITTLAESLYDTVEAELKKKVWNKSEGGHVG